MLSENAKLIVQLSAYIVVLEQEVQALRKTVEGQTARINELVDRLAGDKAPDYGTDGSNQS